MIRDEFVIEMAEFMIETDGGTIDYPVPKVWIARDYSNHYGHQDGVGEYSENTY